MTEGETLAIYYTIRSPWQWCLERISSVQINPFIRNRYENEFHPLQMLMSSYNQSDYMKSIEISEVKMTLVPNFSQLISYNPIDCTNSSTSASKTKVRRPPQPCTLRFEVVSHDSLHHIKHVLFAAHGISHVLDGCDDKDELVRTLSHAAAASRASKTLHGPISETNAQTTGLFISDICPWSVLIAWDATYEQIVDIVSNYFPAMMLDSDKRDPYIQTDIYHPVAVLKAPLGSRGDGVYFVSSLEEIWDIIHGNRMRALKEPPIFLENILKEKRRIPAWVLQREIYPPLLIRQKKFHLRSYIIVLERRRQDSAPSLDVLIYNRHEVRIAYLPFEETTIATNEAQNGCSRDRQAHITNGACSDKTERVLLHHVNELHGMQEKLESFLAATFGNVLLPDMMKRIKISTQENSPMSVIFAIAGVDVMVDVNGSFYLLEVNVNPAAPPREVISDDFCDHLVGFMSDLIHLQLYLQESNCPRDDARIFSQFNFISALQ